MSKSRDDSSPLQAHVSRGNLPPLRRRIAIALLHGDYAPLDSGARGIFLPITRDGRVLDNSPRTLSAPLVVPIVRIAMRFSFCQRRRRVLLAPARPRKNMARGKPELSAQHPLPLDRALFCIGSFSPSLFTRARALPAPARWRWPVVADPPPFDSSRGAQDRLPTWWTATVGIGVVWGPTVHSQRRSGKVVTMRGVV